MTNSVRLLHVDDEPDFAGLTGEFLERENPLLTVDTATSAGDALDHLDQRTYDCIVSDYDMPGRNGIEFLEAVREEYPDLPFILFTGKGSEEIASEALTRGATDYLQKGNGSDQYRLLANRVGNAVEQYHATRRAANLQRIRSLAADINQALVRSSSREEIESQVCDIFVRSEPYVFAWIGGYDPGSERVTPRASAGVDASFLGDVTEPSEGEPSGRTSGGPAIDDRGLTVTQELPVDSPSGGWVAASSDGDVRAAASVPIEFEERLYGHFTVYADRTNVFDTAERELLSELAVDIGHSIHAIETRERLRTERDHRAALFENTLSPTVEFVFDDGEPIIESVNPAFESAFGFEPADIIGESATTILVPDEGQGEHRAIIERTRRGDSIETEVRRRTSSGVHDFLLRILPFEVGEGTLGGYAWYTDVTEQKRREATLEEQQLLLESVLETSIDGILVIDENREYVTWNRRFIDMWDIPEELIGDEPEEMGLEWAREALENPDEFIQSVEYLYDHPHEESRDQLRLADGRVLDRYSGPVEGGDGTYFGRVWFFRDITDRVKRERRLEALHDCTRDLITATTPEEVATVASETADHLLELPMNGVHLYDPRADALVPVAWTEDGETLLGGPPPEIPAGEGLAWDVYRTGDAEVHRDVRDAESVLNPETPFRSEIHLPLGEHGVLLAGSPTADDFAPADETLARVLAANVGVALGRVERAQELEQRNEQLEEFARVVSHDLRNPLNVASGRLELARAECDSEHLDSVQRAHDRMAALIEDLLVLAREGQTVRDVEQVDLAALAEDCWMNVDTVDATLVTDTDRVIAADRSRLQQLLENLFRNAVEHGGGGVTVTVGGLDDGSGFSVADDGPGIPRGEREDVFEAGYSMTEDGTGFGLSIVRQIADAHGWRIRLTESDHGGTRFEVTGVEIDA